MLKWKLRRMMADRKISNKELADRLGVHRNTIQQLKVDKPVTIRLDHLESLCVLLECQPADLFEFSSQDP